MRMLGYAPLLGLALLSCDPVAHSTVTLRPHPAPASGDGGGAAITSPDTSEFRRTEAVLSIVGALAPRFGYAEDPAMPAGGAGAACTRSYSYRGDEKSPPACVLVGPDGTARISFWIMGAFHLPAPAKAFRDALADSLRTEGQVSVDR